MQQRGGAKIDTKLYNACLEGDIAEVERTIGEGADVNKKFTHGKSPLFISSRNGKLPVVDLLIAAGADVNITNDDNATPLFIASQNGHLTIVERLLTAGADVNKADNDETTALYNAVFNNHLDIIYRLIAAGADVNKATNNTTPLFVASQKGHLPVVDRLIAAGADVNMANNNNATPLFVASQKGDLPVVDRLITAGADVNMANNNNATPLFVASQKGDLNIVDRLITAGADVNMANNNNVTPLFVASQNDHLPVVDRLIAAGADVNNANINNATPLFVASQNGHLPAVDRLIAAGADINKAKNNNATPLFVASQNGHLPVVDRLIAAGADINKANNNNVTPLFISSQNGHLPVVDRLIAAGADKTIRTNKGTLPIDVAKTEEIRNLLKDVPKNTIKWLGWSLGDASMLDGVFGDEATATNFALCPVCMKYVIRQDACMYMSHNCSEQRGYYHDKLYQKYKNSDGIINWCTVCGRICKGHSHFELGVAKSSVPPIILGKNPFSKSCEKEGGGGVTEKLLRFRRLREHAKDLQDEVGKMDWWEAMDELCEEMWNAPIVRSRTLKTMLETKKFNIPSTNFPLAIPEVENAPNIPYNGQLPIVHPEKTATFENAYGMNNQYIIQFRHTKADGNMNNHEGPGQQISREAFIMWLENMMADPTSFSFGKCWQFKTAAQLAALNAAEKARMCDAVMHPEEVKAALDMEDEEQRKLAEGYHKAFNVAMDTRRSIRP